MLRNGWTREKKQFSRPRFMLYPGRRLSLSLSLLVAHRYLTPPAPAAVGDQSDGGRGNLEACGPAYFK